MGRAQPTYHCDASPFLFLPCVPGIRWADAAAGHRLTLVKLVRDGTIVVMDYEFDLSKGQGICTSVHDADRGKAEYMVRAVQQS